MMLILSVPPSAPSPYNWKCAEPCAFYLWTPPARTTIVALGSGGRRIGPPEVLSSRGSHKFVPGFVPFFERVPHKSESRVVSTNLWESLLHPWGGWGRGLSMGRCGSGHICLRCDQPPVTPLGGGFDWLVLGCSSLWGWGQSGLAERGHLAPTKHHQRQILTNPDRF